MLNFDFLEKDLRIVSPPHFVYDFSRKMFLILNPMNGPNFIVWFPFLFEVLDNMYIAIVCFPGCDVMNFEIKPFLYMTKKSIQKLKYLENEKSFYDKKKKFILFKELSVTKNCLRPESTPLS